MQTGENWWFPRDMQKAIAAGASDLAMLDVMKIGGVTGWLSAMGQAEAASMPVSSHIFVEASAHLLAVTPTAHWLEFLDTAAAILREPNVIRGRQGRAARPGARYRVGREGGRKLSLLDPKALAPITCLALEAGP